MSCIRDLYTVTDCMLRITKVYTNIQHMGPEKYLPLIMCCMYSGNSFPELKDCPSVRWWQTIISLRKVVDIPAHKIHREFFAVGFQCHYVPSRFLLYIGVEAICNDIFFFLSNRKTGGKTITVPSRKKS